MSGFHFPPPLADGLPQPGAMGAAADPGRADHFLPKEKQEPSVKRDTLYICMACKDAGEGENPGPALLAAVRERLGGHNIRVEPVDCLAVCKRPCTVALAGENKWTYVTGDLCANSADDVVAAALAYAATANGMIPWRQRPVAFRKGVVARIPPLNFAHDGAGVPLEPAK